MAIYAVQFMYADRSARDRARPHHRPYLQSQLEAGKLVKSGPYVDDSGALLIYEVDTEAELQEILSNDPYCTTEGCLGDVSVKEWTIVFDRG
jgi:uncharacterized protein YciI